MEYWGKNLTLFPKLTSKSGSQRPKSIDIRQTEPTDQATIDELEGDHWKCPGTLGVEVSG